MSLAGSARRFSHLFLLDIDVVGREVFEEVLLDGDQPVLASAGAHQCRLFTWNDVQELVRDVGGQLLAGSASKWLSLDAAESIEVIERDATVWPLLGLGGTVLPGTRRVDGGTQLLFAVEPG